MTFRSVPESNLSNLSGLVIDGVQCTSFPEVKSNNMRSSVTLPTDNINRSLNIDPYRQTQMQDQSQSQNIAANKNITSSQNHNQTQYQTQNLGLSISSGYANIADFNSVYQNTPDKPPFYAINKHELFLQDLIQNTTRDVCNSGTLDSSFGDVFGITGHQNDLLHSYSVYSTMSPFLAGSIQPQEPEPVLNISKSKSTSQNKNKRKNRGKSLSISKSISASNGNIKGSGKSSSLPAGVIDFSYAFSEYQDEFGKSQTQPQLQLQLQQNRDQNACDLSNKINYIPTKHIPPPHSSLNSRSDLSNTHNQMQATSQTQLSSQINVHDFNKNVSLGHSQSQSYSNNNGYNFSHGSGQLVSYPPRRAPSEPAINTNAPDMTQNLNQLAMLLGGYSPNSADLNLNADVGMGMGMGMPMPMDIGMDVGVHMNIGGIVMSDMGADTGMGASVGNIGTDSRVVMDMSVDMDMSMKMAMDLGMGMGMGTGTSPITNTKMGANSNNSASGTNNTNLSNDSSRRSFYNEVYKFTTSCVNSAESSGDIYSNSSSAAVNSARKKKNRPFSVDLDLTKTPKSRQSGIKAKQASLDLKRSTITQVQSGSVLHSLNGTINGKSSISQSPMGVKAIVPPSKSGLEPASTPASVPTQVPASIPISVLPSKAKRPGSSATIGSDKNSSHRVDRQLAATTTKPIIFIRPESKLPATQKRKRRLASTNASKNGGTSVIPALDFVSQPGSKPKADVTFGFNHKQDSYSDLVTDKYPTQNLDSATDPMEQKLKQHQDQSQDKLNSYNKNSNRDAIQYHNHTQPQTQTQKLELELELEKSEPESDKTANKNLGGNTKDVEQESDSSNSAANKSKNKRNGSLETLKKDADANANSALAAKSNDSGSRNTSSTTKQPAQNNLQWQRVSEQRRRDAMRENFDLLKRMLPIEYMTSDDGRELARPVLLARFLRWVDDTLIELEAVKVENKALKSVPGRYLSADGPTVVGTTETQIQISSSRPNMSLPYTQ